MKRLNRMNREDAAIIAEWQYSEPYDLYSMDGSEENIADLINGDYVSARDEEGNLIGFYCTGISARVPGGYEAGIYEDDSLIDFGLGMKPELTGQGRGTHFVEEGMAYARTAFPDRGTRLVVAAFNLRAIRTYEKVGFRQTFIFTSPINGHETDFVCMIKEA
ncbi:GNAT family N-acetyltransferase [Paenibacillus sp.]|uniref:GNAT family N-acetyltransferase n=1 Tax=Paenibacillus sp. TaxID=58172 RepID=UPI0028392C1C|nr:GNAT family N-acetyltransferase [Paenibacillus sp.]MDR0269551.1 GNAT family N-acetyltransferase [Paenibacillus sp.]